MTPTDVHEERPSPPARSDTDLGPGMRARSFIVLSILVAVVVAGSALVAAGMMWTSEPGVPDTPAAVTSTIADTTAATIASAGGTAAEATAAATGLTDVSDIAAEVVDSVVTVNVTIDRRGPIDLTGSGSGIILESDGLIVTNAHVVDSASDVSVTLTDGSTLSAEVVGVDTTHDLALLSVDAIGLSPVTLGSTVGLEVGNPVIAVGNPLGLEGGPSVTTGIVSALGRVVGDSEASLEGVIQTDAAITEGSSGGALLDSRGRLIGVTTAVGVSSVGVEGIGFAIPVETVAAVVNTLGGS